MENRALGKSWWREQFILNRDVAHRLSSKSNSAAIPEELIESELFGHVKGAFTGAAAARKGKFELADGATIFLDEVGDMSPKVQAKVLRVLEEQRFEPVGSGNTISVDVRVIAATNKRLDMEIEQGNFPTTDLFYRLNVIPLSSTVAREVRRCPAAG